MKIIKDFSPRELRGLLCNFIPVAIFQGRSEAGPRALGNRSILFHPGMSSGRAYINKIKQREHWRPFAGVILHEYVNEWFDMKRLDESPFMSYAVKVRDEEKANLIPAIIHNDGTCRIQTLKQEQNPNLYEILTLFYEGGSNPPIIGNTSFNLAGDPLVETFEDAIDTLERSELEFLYLPETKELIYVENK